MKSILTLLFILALCACGRAQLNVTYTTDNPRQSDDGLAYEIDILIATTTPFKLGSGQLYFNYDTQAFGENAQRNNKVEVLRPVGSILATVAGFPVYQTPIINDNTTSRLSVAYLQGTSSGCLSGPNVTETPSLLFTLRLVFTAGQAGTTPNVCFEAAELFTNQTFTACGPDGGCAFADCQNNPGTQIVNDLFNCSASLPVELHRFTAERIKTDALLQWQTAREVGSSHFVVEKSTDGLSWMAVGSVAAAGDSEDQRSYHFQDLDFADNAPQVLYRLRMVDLDGRIAYSDIRALFTDPAPNHDARIFPNPTATGIHVQLAEVAERERFLHLYSITGTLVLQEQIRPGETNHRYLDLAGQGLPPGAYLLRLPGGSAKRIVLR